MAKTPRATRQELLDAIDTAALSLASMVGRYQDSIPSLVKVELHEIQAPLIRLLVRSGRIPTPDWDITLPQ